MKKEEEKGWETKWVVTRLRIWIEMMITILIMMIKMMTPGDNNDDQDDDERGEGLEDKMGCDQTGDLDGAFVPPLSDHPCLQCPALSSTNRTQPNRTKTNRTVPNHITLAYNDQHNQYCTIRNHTISNIISQYRPSLCVSLYETIL